MGNGEPKSNNNDILDLSATFDTADHHILINIIKECYGFWDYALHWFEEYLRPHNFKVCIRRKYSKPLDFSVPQGSCSSANISPVTAPSWKASFHMTDK